jgi:hypothetical protein
MLSADLARAAGQASARGATASACSRFAGLKVGTIADESALERHTLMRFSFLGQLPMSLRRNTMLIAAEWGTGQVLWSLLWFFLFVMWLSLVFSIFGDIMRTRSMSGWAKAVWTIFIIFVPFLGVFIYLIVNGGDMNRRSVRSAEEANAANESYIRNVASSSSSDELAKLADLHTSGKLTDSEYSAAKAQIIAS